MKSGIYLKLMGDLEQQIRANQARRVAAAEHVVQPYLPRIPPKFVSRPAATVTPNKEKNHG